MVTAQRPLQAISFLVAAIGLIAVVDAICKAYTDEMHAVQLVWGYFVAIVLVVGCYFTLTGPRPPALLATSRFRLQLLRPAFLVASITTLYIGLTYLPFAEATAIGFSAPLFITALSGPILKERVGIHRWSAVVVGLLGVLIIVRPGGGLWHWASVMPLVGAFFFACFQLTTRALAATENPHTTLFYTSTGGLFWISLLVPFFWTPPGFEHWIVFLSTGTMGALAHVCMIAAFNRGEASLLAPFNYSKMIWSVVLGYFIFDAVPGTNMWIGTLIIIAAGGYVLYRVGRRA